MSIDVQIQHLRNRRTKIVATVGPASNSPKMIESLLDAGVNIFRLNMSHGTHDEHRAVYEHIRSTADRQSSMVAVLADLSGPKIRVGNFREGGIDLVNGEPVTISTRNVEGTPGLIPSQYDALARDVGPGDTILLADGVMELTVEAVSGTEVTCTVVQGGRLTDRKGINLPGVAVSAPCLTEKDKADAHFALELGVDFLAMSFVRRGSDVAQLRELIAHAKSPPWIVAKIERPEALENIDDILDVTDALMVARGDLGVELPPEQVPVAQQQLITRARQKNRPVIVATQMLESMTDNPRPTRAEVADVSHSVACGADAVMLSAESATGSYPLATVEMMGRIAMQTEAQMWQQGAFGSLSRSADSPKRLRFGDAIGRANALLSRDLGVRAIVVLSEGGMSATTMTSARPAAPVVAVTSQASTFHRMSLLWGAIPVLVDPEQLNDPGRLVRELSRSLELAESDQFVLLVRGFHSDPELNMPSITLVRLP